MRKTEPEKTKNIMGKYYTHNIFIIIYIYRIILRSEFELIDREIKIEIFQMMIK